jgi:hypothetical protein
MLIKDLRSLKGDALPVAKLAIVSRSANVPEASVIQIVTKQSLITKSARKPTLQLSSRAETSRPRLPPPEKETRVTEVKATTTKVKAEAVKAEAKEKTRRRWSMKTKPFESQLSPHHLPFQLIASVWTHGLMCI